MNKERQSSFELLRIIAQFMIIFYHILYFAVYPASGLPFYKAIWFPLHIGVPLFVFISGYFGIRPSIKGFIKLAGMVLILSIPYMVDQVLQVHNGLEGGKIITEITILLIIYTILVYSNIHIFVPAITRY